jgi:SOS-response transcriptional repressor LexA
LQNVFRRAQSARVQSTGFKERLRKLIDVAGSQRRLAEVIGKTDGAIIGWLRDSAPYASTLRQIAETTGVSLAWLRDGEGDDDAEIEAFRRRMSTPSLGAAEPEWSGAIGGPRTELRRAREARGLTVEQFAKLIRHPASYVRNVEEGQAPATENFLQAVCKALPELSLDELMSGSDSPRVIDRAGMSGTYGDAPRLAVPAGHSVRNVPVLSFTQAGTQMEWTDELYAHEVFPVIDLPTNAKAFALPLRGDSMEPRYRAGDMVIVLRDADPHTGDEVVACRKNGDVMFKVYSQAGDRITLTSYNKDLHPPLTLARRDLRWVWPVFGVFHRSRHR